MVGADVEAGAAAHNGAAAMTRIVATIAAREWIFMVILPSTGVLAFE
jgi:hypothetical protein